MFQKCVVFIFVLLQILSVRGQLDVVVDDVSQIGFDTIGAGESIMDIVNAGTAEEALEAIANSAEGVITVGEDVVVLGSDLLSVPAASTSEKEFGEGTEDEGDKLLSSVENIQETDKQILEANKETVDVLEDILDVIDPPSPIPGELTLNDALLLEGSLPIIDIAPNADSADLPEYEATVGEEQIVLNTDILYADPNSEIKVILGDENVFINNNESIGAIIYDESVNNNFTDISTETDEENSLKPSTKVINYECDHEGQIIPNSQLSVYFVCKKVNSDLKPVFHECAKNEIYNSTVEGCAPLPGGGNLAWVSQGVDCFSGGFPTEYFDPTMRRYYQLCMDGAAVVAVCDDGWFFDGNDNNCKKEEETKTVFSEVQDCREYTSNLVCTKEGLFPIVYSKNTEGEVLVASGEDYYSYSDTNIQDNCRNCYYECNTVDDFTFELSVICINDDTVVTTAHEQNDEPEEAEYDDLEGNLTPLGDYHTTTAPYDDLNLTEIPSIEDILDFLDYIIPDNQEIFGSTTNSSITIEAESEPTTPLPPISDVDVEIDSALIFEPDSADENTEDTNTSQVPPKENNENCSRKALKDTSCTEKGFFRYKNSCSLHYECYYSEKCKKLLQSDLYVCPQCLKFNPKKGRCDFPEQVNECTYDNKKERYCTAPGTYPVPNSCLKYYSCVEGKPITVKSCGKGQIYDSNKNKCVRRGKCSKTPKCTKEGLFLDKYDCSRYYRCRKNGTKLHEDKRRCSEDEIFNGAFCESKSTSFLGDWDKMNRMYDNH